MNHSEACRLSDVIERFMKSNRLSRQEFADACGLSDSAIRNYLDCRDPQTLEPVDPKLGSLERMASVMQMDVVELICRIKGKTYSAPVIEEPEPIKEEVDVDSPDYLKKVSSHIVPVTHLFPNSGNVYELFNYHNGWGNGFPVEEAYYKPDKTIVYKAIFPLSPFINEKDNVIVWLDEEYKDGDIICVRRKKDRDIFSLFGEYEDVLRFYKISIQKSSGVVLYGDQNFTPIYLNAESNFREDIVGKAVAVIHKF